MTFKINRYADIFTPDDAFKKWVLISAVAHIAFALTVLLKSMVFPGETIVIQSAIRVDMIGLPDKKPEAVPVAPPAPTPAPAPKIEESPKPEAKAPEKPKPKPPKTVDISKSKDQQKQALEKLKQMSAIDKIKQLQKEAASAEAKPAAPQFAGNQVVTGNSFSGVAGLAANDYFNQISSHINNFWALPEWLQDASLKAVIRAKIDESGRLLGAEVAESSGNPAFDNAALSTVEAASPFPVPPPNIRDKIIYNWMMFRFPR